MKKVIYERMTEERAKKMMEVGQYAKTKPITFRDSQKDMFGRPYKMYKITTIMEEVPQSEVQYYFDDTDIQRKYTKDQQDAGAKLYEKNPVWITESKDHGYNNYTRELSWYELGAKKKEEYIKQVIGDDEDDWWP